MTVLGKIYKKIPYNRNIAFCLAKLFCRLHSWSYYLISYFAILADEKRLHPKHRLMKYHDFFVNNISSNYRVIDIGCGNGALSFDIACKAKEVIGIDILEQNINFAQKVFYRENLKFLVADATRYLPGELFDAAVLSNVLEHIKDRTKLLISISKIAKKILIRVPQFDRSWDVLYKKEISLDYRLDETHEIEYIFEELQKELSQAELRIVSSINKFGEFWVVCESK